MRRRPRPTATWLPALCPQAQRAQAQAQPYQTPSPKVQPANPRSAPHPSPAATALAVGVEPNESHAQKNRKAAARAHVTPRNVSPRLTPWQTLSTREGGIASVVVTARGS